MKHTSPPSPWLELTTIMERDGHWTWRSLAAASGYTSSYLHQTANGKCRPSTQCIRALADVLDVPYSVLAPSPRTDESLRVLHALLAEMDHNNDQTVPLDDTSVGAA